MPSKVLSIALSVSLISLPVSQAAAAAVQAAAVAAPLTSAPILPGLQTGLAPTSAPLSLTPSLALPRQTLPGVSPAGLSPSSPLSPVRVLPIKQEEPLQPAAARQTLEAGAAQVQEAADAPAEQRSVLDSLFAGTRQQPPSGEAEVIVNVPTPGAITQDIRVRDLSSERYFYLQADRAGIPRSLVEEHGGRPTGSLRRLNMLIFKAPAKKAPELAQRLGSLGYEARLRESFKMTLDDGQKPPVFHRVGLSEMAHIIRADLLQAELKKALGEPVMPTKERFRDQTMPILAKGLAWLKKTFLSLALGINPLNPVLPWAILDTYVKTDHPFLKERIVGEAKNKPDGEIHGTHTAGTVVGMDIFNWHGRVYDILPGGWYDQGETLMLLNQAANDGALATTNSWGKYEGNPDADETKLFEKLAAEGIHANIAAGNSGEWGSDSVGAPGIAYHFADLRVNGMPVGRAKRIKTVASADHEMKTAESSSRGPGSITTAENFEEYTNYPRKPDEAGIGMHLVAPTFGPGEFVRFEPELGGPGRPLSGTSMATPGTFGGFLLLTRAVLVLLADYLPKLPGKDTTLFAMDLARLAMTKTGRKAAPEIEQGDGFIDVWAAFEYSAALLKAANTRALPTVRELLRSLFGLGGYGDSLVSRLADELADPANALKEDPPGPKPPFAIQRPSAKHKQPTAIQATLFDPDPRYGYVSLLDGTLRKLELSTGRELWSARAGSGQFNSLLLAHDGKRLYAAGEDNFIRELDLETGREVRKFRGNWRRGVKAVLQSPDGKRLFAATGDKNTYMIDAETGQELQRFVGHKDFVLSMALSGDGKALFTGGADKTARQWDVESGREIRSYPIKDDWVYSLAVTRDGSRLFTGSAKTQMWDTSNGEMLAELQWKTDWVHSLTISADSKYLFAALSGKSLVMWDIAGRGKAALFKGHKSNVLSVALSADERRLLSGGDDPNLLVWEVPDPSELPAPIEEGAEAPPEDAAGMPGQNPEEEKPNPASPGGGEAPRSPAR
ncbi:MAG: S8 family serine peptidase [Elusimicrobiota bacterium]